MWWTVGCVSEGQDKWLGVCDQPRSAQSPWLFQIPECFVGLAQP